MACTVLGLECKHFLNSNISTLSLQAGNALQSQMNKQTVSALALTEAKTEIINLRERLSEKDGILNQLASKVTEISSEYSTLRNSYEIAKRKETETDLVVQHLMEEIEEARRTKPHDASLSFPPTSPSLSEEQRLHSLRVELEEMYAKQIDTMKEKFVGEQQHEVEHVTRELHKIKTEHEQSLTKIAEYQVQLQEYEILIGQVERVQQENIVYINSNDELKNKINMQHDVVMNLKIEMDTLLDDNQSYRDQIVMLREKCDLQNEAMAQVSSEKEILIVNLEKMASEIETIRKQSSAQEMSVSDEEQVEIHGVDIEQSCDSDEKENSSQEFPPENYVFSEKQTNAHDKEEQNSSQASANISANDSVEFKTMQESLTNAVSESECLKREISELISERDFLKERISDTVIGRDDEIPESFKLHLETLKTDNKELVLSNKTMQTDLKLLQVERDRLLVEKKSSEEEQGQLQEQVNELSSEIQNLSNVVEKYRSELECAKNEICRTKEEKEDLNAQISNLHFKINEVEKEKSVLMEKVENWRQELSHYANEQETLSNELNSVKQNNVVLQTELESSRQDLSIAKKEKEELNSQILSLQCVQNDETKEMVLMNKIEESKQEIIDLSQGRERLVSDLKHVKLDNDKLCVELEETKSKFLMHDKQMNSVTCERDKLLTEINESQIRFSSLETQYEEIFSRLSAADVWRKQITSLLEGKAHLGKLLPMKKHAKEISDSDTKTEQITDDSQISSSVVSCLHEKSGSENVVPCEVPNTDGIDTGEVEACAEKAMLELNNNVDNDLSTNFGAGDAQSPNAVCEESEERLRTVQCEAHSVAVEQQGGTIYETLEERTIEKPSAVDSNTDLFSVDQQVLSATVDSDTEYGQSIGEAKFLEVLLEKVDELLTEREHFYTKIGSKEREVMELSACLELTVMAKNNLQQEIENLTLASVTQSAHIMDLENINEREVKNVKEELRRTNEELASLLSSISDHSTQIEDLRTQSQMDLALTVHEEQTQIEYYKSRLSSVEIELEEYKISVEKLDREKDEFHENEKCIKNEFEEYKRLLVENHQQECEKLQVELQELRDKARLSCEVPLADLNENLIAKDLELKTMMDEKNELCEKVEHYIVQVRNYSAEMEKLQRDMSERELVHNDVLKSIETEKAILTKNLEETEKELDASKGDNLTLQNQIRFIREEKSEVERLETMRMSQEEILELTAKYEQTRENLYQILKENEELKYQQELNWAASDDIKQQWVDQMEHYKKEYESAKFSITNMSQELENLKAENADLKSKGISMDVVSDPSKDKCIEELVQQNVELRQMVQSASNVAGEQLKNYQSESEAMKQELTGIQGQLDYLTAENLALKHVIDSQSTDTASKKHVVDEITKFKDDNMALKMSLDAMKMQLMSAVEEIENNKKQFEKEKLEWQASQPELLDTKETGPGNTNETENATQTLQTLQYENKLLTASLENTRSQVFVLTSEIDTLKDQLILSTQTKDCKLKFDSTDGMETETQTELHLIEQVEDGSQTENVDNNSETLISNTNVDFTAATSESLGIKHEEDESCESEPLAKSKKTVLIVEDLLKESTPTSSKLELEMELCRIKDQAEDFGDYIKLLEGQLSSLENMLEVPSDVSLLSENAISSQEERRFEKLNQCLNETLRTKENLSLDLEKVNKELSEVTSENDDLKMKNEILKSEHEMYSGENQDISPVIEQLKEQLKSVSCDHNKLKSYTEQLEFEISQLSDNRDQLKSQLDVIMSEMTSLTDSSSSMSLQLVASKSEKEKLAKKNKTLNDKVTSLGQQFQELSESSNKRVQELNDDRENFNDIAQQNEKLSERNRKLEEEVVYLVSKHSEDREELMDRMREMTQDFEGLKTLKEKLETEKEELIQERESDTVSAESVVNLLQLERDKLQLSQDTMVDDLQDMQMKFENVQSLLEKTKKNYEKEVEQFKADFASVTKDMTFMNDTVHKLEVDLQEVTDEKEQLKELLSRHQINNNLSGETLQPDNMNEKKIKDLQNRNVAFEQHIAQMELEEDTEMNIEGKLTTEIDTQTEITGELKSNISAGETSEGLGEIKIVLSAEEVKTDMPCPVDSTNRSVTMVDDLEHHDRSHSVFTQTSQAQVDLGTQTIIEEVDLMSSTLARAPCCDGQTQTDTLTTLYDSEDVTLGSPLSDNSSYETVCQKTQTDECSLHHDADVDKIVAGYEKRVSEIYSEMDRLQKEYGVLRNMHDEEITGLRQTVENMKLEFDGRDQSENVDNEDSEPSVEVSEHIEEVTEVTENYLRERAYELEERYAMEFRDKQTDLMHQLDVEKRDYKKELEQVFKHQVAAVRAEKDQAFVHALQKMRSEFEKRRKDEMEKLRLELLKDAGTSVVGDTVESRIGVVVEKLYRENQVSTMQ